MEAGGLDIFQILLQSGIIVKFVLLVLVACSVLSWAIILQKKKVITNIEKNNTEFHECFKNSSNLVEIYEKCDQIETSTISLMFKYGYDESVKS